ncbi:MAG: NAD-dependent epimerase/dehydratase family protein, partial [Williamsia sp.]|nr:NAD-dependent epimerase/dehydratase family protein [Williamsia sp.]
MQTILGAGGPIANSLAGILSKKEEPLRLVSRRHQPAVGNTSWMKADLLNWAELLAAAKGSSIIYMCAGLRYDKKVWAVEWPQITDNLIRLAKETGARLIFFDNVYMYGHTQGAMTEKTPYHPSSIKGEIRARTAEKLMQEGGAGRISVAIARAADFYGAESMNSFVDSMVLAKLAKGQKASWLGNVNTKHS